MNLRDRMNFGLQDSGQTESEKKLSTNNITEKSSQQPKASVMQSQSETIRKQAQEMRILSSENLILKKKLQEQSAEIVSLNEQIGKLSGADLVLRQNEELVRKNSELRKNASDTEARAEAVKASYARKEEKLQKKLTRAEELEQDASRKNAEMDKRISDLADERIADIKRILEERCRNVEEKARGKYLLLEQKCKKDYEVREKAAESFTWSCLLFAILAMVFTAIKSAHFSHDLVEVFLFIGGFLGGVGISAWDLGKAAWSLHTQIQIPVIQFILPAILAVLAFLLVIGIAAGVLGFPGYKIVCFYREHFADWISAYVAITELAFTVWFADMLSFVKLNLIVCMIVIHFVYIFVRMLATRERNSFSGW